MNWKTVLRWTVVIVLAIGAWEAIRVSVGHSGASLAWLKQHDAELDRLGEIDGIQWEAIFWIGEQAGLTNRQVLDAALPKGWPARSLIPGI